VKSISLIYQRWLLITLIQKIDFSPLGINSATLQFIKHVVTWTEVIWIKFYEYAK